jgi:hypothetical protein
LICIKARPAAQAFIVRNTQDDGCVGGLQAIKGTSLIASPSWDGMARPPSSSGRSDDLSGRRIADVETGRLCARPVGRVRVGQGAAGWFYTGNKLLERCHGAPSLAEAYIMGTVDGAQYGGELAGDYKGHRYAFY